MFPSCGLNIYISCWTKGFALLSLACYKYLFIGLLLKSLEFSGDAVNTEGDEYPF
jgi:hypothetical protein